MSRCSVLAVTMTLAGNVLVAGAHTDADLRQVLALQKVMQKVIADVEPSIACILVSRSERYARFGQGPTLPLRGKLGRFSSRELEGHAGFRQMNGEEKEALLFRLDMSHSRYVPEGFGSGVALNERGLVLTSYHVVRGATKIFVRLPGGAASYADIHAADPRSDLAVLRLLDPSIRTKAIKLGEGGKVKRAQFVLSIANPFAVGFRDGKPSVSWGIISNVRRRAPGKPNELDRAKTLHHYGTLLQTDARLHLGCSGGALVNLRGEMIGLTTALAAIHGGETPGGFAVPVDAGMRRTIDVLKRGEEVDYGFLGVGFQEQQRQDDGGVALSHVTSGSPAERQGKLNRGDVILAINDQPLRHSDDLFVLLGKQLSGSSIRLSVRSRAGIRRTTVVTLAKFYVEQKAIHSSLGQRPFFRGMRVDYTSLLVQRTPRMSWIPQGVLITEVQPNTRAATAQLKPGEVITHVNNRIVRTPSDFYRAVAGSAGRIELLLSPALSHHPAAKVILQ